jgi:hypothetical protein
VSGRGAFSFLAQAFDHGTSQMSSNPDSEKRQKTSDKSEEVGINKKFHDRPRHRYNRHGKSGNVEIRNEK